MILIISQAIYLITCNKGKNIFREVQSNPENTILYHGITLMVFIIQLLSEKWEGVNIKLSFCEKRFNRVWLNYFPLNGRMTSTPLLLAFLFFAELSISTCRPL